jgi:hypothetical protein
MFGRRLSIILVAAVGLTVAVELAPDASADAARPGIPTTATSRTGRAALVSWARTTSYQRSLSRPRTSSPAPAR